MSRFYDPCNRAGQGLNEMPISKSIWPYVIKKPKSIPHTKKEEKVGREQGERLAKIAMAKSMLSMGMSKEQVLMIAGFDDWE